MTETLALKYRPTTFEDLVGQRAVNLPLRAMVSTDRVPSALLFKGSSGTGKTSTARILAAALNCDSPPGPCGQCVPCKAVVNGTSYDLIEIDGASNGLVDDIRALRQNVLYGASGRYRVVVLDEAHSVSTAAFNALLKTIEEPPPATVFILCTTDPGRIPETVVNRCMSFSFHKISVGDIAGRLAAIAEAEGLCVEAGLLDRIAGDASGALRDAVMKLDQLIRSGITTLAGYLDLIGDQDDAPQLLHAITNADPAAAYRLLDAALTRTGDATAITHGLIACLRDVLILHSGGSIAASGQARQHRDQLTQVLPIATAFNYLTVLWDLTRIRAGEDPRSGLDLAVAMLLHTAAKHRPTPPPAPPRKLTLHEMASLRPTMPGQQVQQ